MLVFAALFITMAFRPVDAGSAIKTVDYYGDAANSGKLLSLIKAEISAKRKPALFFTATWCGPCKKFKSALSDPMMQEAMNGITLIMIDADIDGGKEKFGAKYKVSAYPTFLKMDADGNSLKKIDGGAWNEDTPANMAPAMKKFME